MVPEFTFEQDQLNRKLVSDNIEKYINFIQEKNSGHAVSFAINAKWGEGKTYFISMWKHQIEERTGNVAVYYNAWENDDCDSALLPLLYNIISTCGEDEESECFIEHAKFFMKTLGMNTLKFSVNKFLGNYEEIANIVSGSFEDMRNADIKTLFSEYDEYYGKRKKLQESLKELIPSNGNLWVFVDDLDRCNPIFAINTLECIKHFFNIEHIIFIFAIDYNHLAIAAKQIYGREIDSTSYMKKFFDVIYQLPSLNQCKYVQYRISRIQDVTIRTFIKKERETLELYFKKFDFSLRDIDLTMTHVELFCLGHLEELKQCKKIDVALSVYFYFISIKDKYNKEYMDIIHGHFSVDSSKSNVWQTLNPKFFVCKEINKLLEAISNGQAERHTLDIIKKYSLIEIPLINKFSEHIEYILQ